jgi:hypothetical protein
MLFSHRNPGEDVSQAVSITGQLYSTLPNAFRYRQTVDAACSCRHPGESWAQALKSLDDSTVEQGDIVVNEQRARALSQPRVDAQGKPIKPEPRANAKPAPQSLTPPAAEVDPTLGKPNPSRTVRDVGPPFLPPR